MTPLLQPMLASGALQFAFEKATTEGKITISALGLLSTCATDIAQSAWLTDATANGFS